MNEAHYIEACNGVLGEIGQYSPHAKAMLDKIRDLTGSQWAYYAGVIIESLEARVQAEGINVLETVSFASLRSHTFFQLGSIYDDAHVLFMNALEAYRLDRQRRQFPQHSLHLAID